MGGKVYVFPTVKISIHFDNKLFLIKNRYKIPY